MVTAKCPYCIDVIRITSRTTIALTVFGVQSRQLYISHAQWCVYLLLQRLKRCFVVQTPTSQLIGSVFVIAGGTAVAGYGEINISITGMLIQLISESSEALRLIMTQTLLQGLSFHPIEGMMYLAPACLMWMVVGAAILEFPTILREGALSIITENTFLFFAAASMGFAVTTLAFFTIQLCGSLTLKVRHPSAEISPDTLNALSGGQSISLRCYTSPRY